MKEAVSTAPELSEDNPCILRKGDGQVNTLTIELPRTLAFAAVTENDWKVRLNAWESRFSFGASTDDVAGHTFRAHLEMNFDQGIGAPGNEVVSNDNSPRLRQAYGNIRLPDFLKWEMFESHFLIKNCTIY